MAAHKGCPCLPLLSILWSDIPFCDNRKPWLPTKAALFTLANHSLIRHPRALVYPYPYSDHPYQKLKSFAILTYYTFHIAMLQYCSIALKVLHYCNIAQKVLHYCIIALRSGLLITFFELDIKEFKACIWKHPPSLGKTLRHDVSCKV